MSPPAMLSSPDSPVPDVPAASVMVELPGSIPVPPAPPPVPATERPLSMASSKVSAVFSKPCHKRIVTMMQKRRSFFWSKKK